MNYSFVFLYYSKTYKYDLCTWKYYYFNNCITYLIPKARYLITTELPLYALHCEACLGYYQTAIIVAMDYKYSI